ncbi:MAG TPA: hypothetical protein PLY78_08760 [Methanospirillum sp.]|nr:hypothetical protein [Methanospirillum sp.]
MTAISSASNGSPAGVREKRRESSIPPANTAAFLTRPSRTSITLLTGAVYRNGAMAKFIALPKADRFAALT